MPTSAATPNEARGTSVACARVVRRFAGGAPIVDGLDLDVAPGEFVSLLGPSGCGKSTLLRLVAGLDAPQGGTVRLGGEAPSKVAFVFQEAQLLPWRDVLSNAALPLELGHVPREVRHARATEALTRVGLGDALTKLPHELSGGMRMRVSLARALVTDPTLLLLDEPFAALDELTRQRLDDQLRELWRERGMTVLFVTHSVDEAAYLADRAVVFSTRPARVVLDRPIDLGAARAVELRGTPEFAAHTRALRDALVRGGG